jgi:hypothetical protein
MPKPTLTTASALTHNTGKARLARFPSGDLFILKEKVAALEAWRASTEADLKEIREVISQVKLLISLSIGGGGLSIITLIITINRMVNP